MRDATPHARWRASLRLADAQAGSTQCNDDGDVYWSAMHLESWRAPHTPVAKQLGGRFLLQTKRSRAGGKRLNQALNFAIPGRLLAALIGMHASQSLSHCPSTAQP